MQRVAFKMKLFKGCEDEYKRRHDALWPELESLLRQTGIKDYSIFLDASTGDLFAVLDVADTQKLDNLRQEEVMKTNAGLNQERS